MVRVMVGVSLGGRVISSVSGTGVSVLSRVAVDVRGVEEAFGVEASDETETRLTVGEGSAAALVGVVTSLAANADPRPGPIKRTTIPTKANPMIRLRIRPPTEGRSRRAKRVNRPKKLASARCVTATSAPCGH